MNSILFYAHIEEVVTCSVVKLFSCLIITSERVGAMTWEFWGNVRLCFLYLPIPTRTQNSSNKPLFFSPKLFEKNILFNDYEIVSVIRFWSL